MLPQVRIVLITTCASSLWFIADAIKCLVSGRFLGQRLDPSHVSATPHALQLTDGSYVDYGVWAAWLVAQGFDPHDLAPVFLVLGILGLVGLYFFLAARPIGWALLVGFAIFSFPRLGAVGISSAVLLLTLLLPSTRRLIFAVDEESLEGLSLVPTEEKNAE